MAINLVTKYADKLLQPYKKESVIEGRFNTEFEWSGAKTISVLTATTVAPTDYNRTLAANRFGTPAEMQDTKQDLTLSQDKSFSLIIDKGNFEDQNNLKEAGKMLKAQQSEQMVPTRDAYCLGKLADADKTGTTPNHTGSAAITKNNAVEMILAGLAALDDAEMPDANRTVFVPAFVYNMIRLAPEFVGLEGLGVKSVGKGEVGELGGAAVVKVPAGRWVSGYDFIIAHKDSWTAPVKIKTARVLDKVAGIDGNVLEGRDYYDCFVFDARKGGIYAQKSHA